MVKILPLEYAKERAEEVVKWLQPACVQVEVVGSIRRKRPLVHDIDIVAQSACGDLEIPGPLGSVTEKNVLVLPLQVDLLIKQGVFTPRVKKDGKTMVGESVALVTYKDVPVDLYYATAETWGGLLLIRTGSARHNIRLTSIAKSRGWKLHASGLGVWDKRGRLTVTEGNVTRADCDHERREIKPAAEGFEGYRLANETGAMTCLDCGARRLDDWTEEGILQLLLGEYVPPMKREAT